MNTNNNVLNTIFTNEVAFDFSSLSTGTPIRVCPTLIDDLSVGGNKRRNKTRSNDFKESIRAKGVIQSLSVRPSVANPHRLELCAGYGRRDTALEFGLTSVPVIVNSFSDKEALAIMLTENRERENISIVDEADLAQSYLSLHDGDLATAATHLGLSQKVFRERLQLKRLDEKVLVALADDSNKFTLGHALILTTFDVETQLKTLSAILGDPQTYTVKELKLRASKRQIELSKACFNTADCNSCQHNTGEQFDLLGDNDNGSNCSNPKCFNEKSQDWVKNTRIPQLEEKFGRVILWEVKPEQDRRSVSKEKVGETQFQNGCMNCENKCTVVDDRPMRWGNFIEDQCIDTDCYNTCTASLTKAKAETQKTATTQTAENQDSDSVANTLTVNTNANIEKTKQKTVIAKTSANCLDDYKAQIRKSSVNTVLKDAQFRMALALASLCEVSGYKPECIKEDSYTSFNNMTVIFMQLDIKTIQFEMGNAVTHHATVGSNHNPTELMINILSKRDDGKAIAQRDWMPTEKRLAMYNIAQLENLCEVSGFAKSYKENIGEKEYSQLFKNRKDTIVKTIIKYKFDWTDFAPKDYLALIK
ncbi:MULTISPECIES: ParB/RepB/Spo0J family partition protein [unclassified Pseudoalteromonas]|uniref:ParB/RepB/Spo0J family partition protein n=1 Tax=unclassified Pseudoalteromonas TaxID=194690 RepID=UPI000426330C|nr:MULTISPECIES: ParB/RepB/Spo0J family partition protein [unclassified Pseudoalteromonas]